MYLNFQVNGKPMMDYNLTPTNNGYQLNNDIFNLDVFDKPFKEGNNGPMVNQGYQPPQSKKKKKRKNPLGGGGNPFPPPGGSSSPFSPGGGNKPFPGGHVDEDGVTTIYLNEDGTPFELPKGTVFDENGDLVYQVKLLCQSNVMK